MAATARGPPPLDSQLPDGSDDNETYEESIIQDQDDAQAILQPAMSAAASRLTSQNTPAIEKARALEKQADPGLFDSSSGEGDDGSDSSPEQAATPERTPRIAIEKPQSPSGRSEVPNLSLGQLPNSLPTRDPLPSPWQAGPKPLVFKDTGPRPSKGVLESAFGQSRSRSRSTGQEALRRLQKAFPSLSSPSHLLPSIPTSFFSGFSDKPNSASSSSSRLPSSPKSATEKPSLSTPEFPSRPTGRPQLASNRTSNRTSVNGPLSSHPAPPPSRPPMLRRVTSDDSILYHSLSRASSLGDDDQFQDVREMVNMRFMALKDSLPERPNFKMPSLPKLYAPSRKSISSLGTIHSTDALSTQPNVARDTAAASKDPTTALDRALEHLTGDIVILGGYRGSVLRTAEPPYQQIWAPLKLGLNMRKVNLEVGLDDEDEERMEEKIKPSGMLKHIGPIDVSQKLIKKMKSCENARAGKLRVWDFGYDWRLSPPISSRKLQEFLQKLPSNQPGTPVESRGALVIAHSLGGVITRHAVNARPELFSSVLYAGVPQRCINILGPLRNGDVVLLNEKLLTAQVNFSMRTSFAFLPEDGFCFINKFTGEEYPIDFYDPKEWEKHRLSPCVGPILPAYSRPHSSSLSSFLPNPLRARADSRSKETPQSPTIPNHKDRTIAPQMNPGTASNQVASAVSQANAQAPSHPEQERNMEYLGRTMAMIRKFRSELTHRSDHQEANAYPPMAVLYGKSIPTVYAAHVPSRDAIPCVDAYDDLQFRAGDGVVLAKESMLPDGYSVVRGGRVCTERGHITMMGDMPAVGRALEALIRGRRKGIGMGHAESK